MFLGWNLVCRSSAMVAVFVAMIALSSFGASPSISDAVADNSDEPGATTTAAVMIGPAGATLTGAITPNSHATTYRFLWGKTSSYGAITLSTSAGSGATSRSVSTMITGLGSSTTYHYRIVASSDGGTTAGEDRIFTTLPPAPLATTGAASAIDQTSATLTASVTPNNSATSYHFELGATTAYGSVWPASDTAIASDSLAHAVAQAVSGLIPGTTYHYRVVASSASGATYGNDQSFTTTPPAAAPPAQTLPPATQPALGHSATISTVSGSVLVQLPGGAHLLSLDAPSTVPVGTTIDASHGTVKLTNVRDAKGKLQTAHFWGGSFTVQQKRLKHAPTVLTLAGTMSCPKARHLASASSASAPTTRQLWGQDNHGRFVTRGRSAVATVRGTTWVMRDTCAGTRVTVTRGSVSVHDLVKHRTLTLAAGHSYLART